MLICGTLTRAIFSERTLPRYELDMVDRVAITHDYHEESLVLG
jgi:hypothetical protein